MTLPISLTPDYTFIKSDQDLKRFVDQWVKLDNIIIDTEFMRTNTFYPKPALIQVAAGSDYFLIDPLGLDDIQAFADLLENTSVVKVLHASSEDIELFQTYLGVKPAPLFDTQVAASFLGHGLSVGYKNLVSSLFDVDLPKGEQRSNWLQRPLSDKQLSYAIADVTFLAEIYRVQKELLEESGRISWVEEECANLLANQVTEIPVEQAYQRVKNGWKLTPPELGVMKALAEWREREARERDMPRGFILKDYQLIELAQQRPQTTDELFKISGMLKSRVRHDGDRILSIIRQAGNNVTEITPMPGPLPPSAKAVVKELQAHVSKIAREYDLAPQLLMNRKSLVKLIHTLIGEGNTALPVELPSWKKGLLGNSLTELLDQYRGKLHS